ncbi:hypothetical protein LY76DRAFT_610321 [Colletotrichum caudatum]|nr:hypothetical protein LY76DRAFT_610321 [Colletotrichum caudatum]
MPSVVNLGLGPVSFSAQRMAPSSSRSRSQSRVDLAMRERQLRRFHKHLVQSQDPDQQQQHLRDHFTPAVLNQLDTLKGWEENWGNKRSLSTQLQYISRWYEDKVAAAAAAAADCNDNEDRDEAATAAAPRGNATNAALPAELNGPPDRPKSLPPSAFRPWPLPPAAAPSLTTTSTPQVDSVSGSVIKGPPVGAAMTKGVQTRRQSLPRRPAWPLSSQPVDTSMPPPAITAGGPICLDDDGDEDEDDDNDARNVNIMLQEMRRYAQVYDKMEPEFLTSLEATKAASMADRTFVDKREFLGAARRETSSSKAAMEAREMDAKLAKRAAAVKGQGAPDERQQQQQQQQRDQERQRSWGAWREAREAWWDALGQEHKAYRAVTEAIKALGIAESAEESADRKWTEVLKRLPQ